MPLESTITCLYMIFVHHTQVCHTRELLELRIELRKSEFDVMLVMIEYTSFKFSSESGARSLKRASLPLSARDRSVRTKQRNHRTALRDSVCLLLDLRLSLLDYIIPIGG